VGFSGFLVDTCFYLGLQRVLNFGHIAARAISFWPAVTWGWAWHRVLTFSDRPKTAKPFQWLKFCTSSSISFAFNWGIYTFLTQTIAFFQAHLFIAFITGILSAAALNFTFSNFLVFADTRKKNL
jgi:dolichol-phosphate mannosyltransferase